jgi:hypothetical protein
MVPLRERNGREAPVLRILQEPVLEHEAGEGLKDQEEARAGVQELQSREKEGVIQGK